MLIISNLLVHSLGFGCLLFGMSDWTIVDWRLENGIILRKAFIW
jgi:hypothetical protein